jgi:tetratricopeptide (TPR) repeat protein
VAPDAGDLRTNQRAVWEWYVDDAMTGGKDDRLADLLRRAAADTGAGTFNNPAEWYCRLGERRLKAAGLEEGLAVAARGLAALPDDQRRSLRDWQMGVCRRRSQECLKAGDVDGSLAALARAVDLDPTHREFEVAVAYHVQEALRIVDAAAGPAAAAAHYTAITSRFSKVTGANRMMKAHARRRALALAETGRTEDALTLVGQYASALPDGDRAEVAGAVYDASAKRLAAAGKWEDALRTYADGLKAYPGLRVLTSNVAVTVDRWADPAIRAQNWDEAIRAYDAGLKLFPDHGHLKHNRKYCESMKERK